MADEYTNEYSQAEMDTCMKKMMGNGKNKAQAGQMCKLSLSNRKKPIKKAKPNRVVADSENEAHYVFSSGTKIDSSSNGTLIKDIEIFKTGTFKGIEFQQSALEKMVANFHFLRDHGTFPNVPVRADHPGWLGEVGVIDRVGGYVADLRTVGSKLVADIRVTSTDMLNKIKEGSYISRSSEIGGYEDNKGNIYDPILYGFAFVDIPAVEGLSPKFSFSKDKNVQLINLNQENTMGDEIIETPAAETVVETPAETVVVETPAETVETPVVESVVETPAEIVVEEAPATTELSKKVDMVEFAKAFPTEAAELEKFRTEQFDSYIDSLVSAGKVLPATKEVEVAFVKSLTVEQFAAYKVVKEATPAIVKFNAEIVKEEKAPVPTVENAENPTSKAAEFIEKTN